MMVEGAVNIDRFMEFLEGLVKDAEWKLHETFFRAGEISGQRDIQASYATLTNGGNYTLIYKGRIDSSDTVYIWEKKR